MKLLLIVAISICFSGAAHAQHTEPVTDAKLALARQLLTLSNGWELGSVIMGGSMSDKYKVIAAKMITDMGLPSGPIRKDTLDKTIDHEINDIFLPKYMDNAAHEYAAAFSEKELSDGVDFFNSASGHAFIAKMPGLIKSVTPVFREYNISIMRNIFLNYCESIKCPQREYDRLKLITQSKAP